MDFHYEILRFIDQLEKKNSMEYSFKSFLEKNVRLKIINKWIEIWTDIQIYSLDIQHQ